MTANDPDAAQEASAAATDVLPLAEDGISIGKREVVTGRVRVRTLTETSEEIVRESLLGTTAEVERVPADRVLQAGEPPPAPRTEGNVVVVPIVEEVLVVEKQLVLKEEVRITLNETSEVAEVPVTVRKQRAVVERVETDDAPNPNRQSIREED